VATGFCPDSLGELTALPRPTIADFRGGVGPPTKGKRGER